MSDPREELHGQRLKMLTPPGPTSRPTTISTMPTSSPPRTICTMPAITRTTAISQRMKVIAGIPPRMFGRVVSTGVEAGASGPAIPNPARLMPRPSAGGRPEQLHGAFAHLHLPDLPGHRHRELVDDQDVAGDLLVGQLAEAERPQTLAVQGLGALPQPEPDHELLAVLLVGDTDDLGIDDVGMGVEELLDLARVDVLAAADDHVLDAAGDLHVAVLVHDGEVSGVHPPVTDRLCGAL